MVAGDVGLSWMLQGLYKVEMQTVHGSRRGVLYVYDGKMMGGNSAFAFVGTYRESDSGEVTVDISALRHYDDPNFQPLFKTDKITLTLKGRRQGEQYHFEGGTPQLPGVVFNSVMTPISEEAAPPVAAAGAGRHQQRSLFDPYPDARRHRRRQYRRHGAA